jgi:hypothetical protein
MRAPRQFLEVIASELGARTPGIHIPYPALYAVAVIAERLALTRGIHPVVCGWDVPLVR